LITIAITIGPSSKLSVNFEFHNVMFEFFAEFFILSSPTVIELLGS